MKTILAIDFNTANPQINFRIEDPAFLPVEGTSMDCRWEDYIDDQKALDFLEDFDNNGIWLVNISGVRYTKDECTMYVTLFEVKDYYNWIETLRKDNAVS